MCGIVGIVGVEKNKDAWARDALDKLKSRGPDSSQLISTDKRIFGATRLAMVDPHPRSNQPFRRFESLFVFNGEIYNYKEIQALGLSQEALETSSDTEVLFNLLRACGVKGLNLVNGMYAFAYYEGVTDTLFLSRDRLGKKPLYYRRTQNGNEFAFCSLQHPLRSLESNTTSGIALVNFLHIGFLLDPFTMHKEITSVRPLEIISIGERRKDLITSTYNSHSNKVQKTESLRKLITECVVTRVLGENRVSLSLSGGLDSTVLAIVLSEQGINTTTFSVRWPDSDKKRYNYDFEKAESTASNLGLDFQEVKSLNADEVPKYLDCYLELMEEPNNNPTGVSMIPLYKTIANQGFRLTLTGDGADEIFGGYSRYKLLDKYQWLIDSVPPFFLKNLRRFGVMKKFMKMQMVDYQDWAGWHEVFSKEELTEAVNLPKVEIDRAFMQLEQECHSLQSFNDDSALKRMMALDQNIWLAMESNRRLDRVSMAFSVEARSPFQDDRLYALWKSRNSKEISNKIGKRDLVEAFPELKRLEISSHKTGFSSPIGHWLRVNSEWVKNNLDWLREAGVTRDLQFKDINANLVEGDFRKLKQIWTLVVLSCWMQKNEVFMEDFA